jgi:glycosyltransferase involved in cell wall biosynthesis
MAARLPLITTSVGAEGLGASDGVQIIVRDDPKGLAQATLDILNDHKKAQKIAINARELVETKYSWEKMSEELDKIYEKTKIS